MTPLDDPVLTRWLAALGQFQPGLPAPVAQAMVEGTAKGPLGLQLRQIEEALQKFDGSPVENLTGSEVRVTIAILHQMNMELAQLLAKLNGLWEQP